jgi:hypothetical protein
METIDLLGKEPEKFGPLTERAPEVEPGAGEDKGSDACGLVGGEAVADGSAG